MPIPFHLRFLLLVLLCPMVWGCNEDRFALSNSSKARPIDTRKRLLPRPLARRKGQRPTRPPQLPSGLRFESNTSHAAGIRSLAVDPAGLYALSGGADRQLMLWDLKQQKKVRSWHSFAGAIRTLQFSADGRRFVLLEGDNTLSLWSMQGKRLHQYTSPGRLHDAHFSPLDNHILAVNQTGQLLWFHGTRLERLRHQQICPVGVAARHLVFDTAQRWMVISCANGTLVVRNWSGSQHQSITHNSTIQALALSSQGDWLASGSADTQLTLWRIHPKTLALRKVHQRRGHLQTITRLKFHPSLPQLATASRDNTVGIWAYSDKEFALLRYLKHKTSVESLAYVAAEKRQLLTGNHLGVLQLWTDNGQRLMRKEPPSWRAHTLSFSSRNDWLASDTAGSAAAIWDLRTGQQLLSLTLHPFPVLHIEFARNGNRLLSADRRNIVFWDLQRRRPIGVINPPKRTQLTAATLGRDWTQVFYGMDSGGVDLWTLAGPKRLYRDRIPQCVTAVAFHPRQRRAAAATCEGRLYLYDFRRYQLITRRKIAQQSILRLQFSSQGDRLLVLTARQATLWQVPQLKQVARISHDHTLLSATFGPQGKDVLLGSADRSVYVWSLQANRLTKLLTGCHTPVRGIRVSPRSPLLAVACFDGNIQLWQWQPTPSRAAAKGRKSPKHLATFVGLPNQQWLTYTPQLFFAASADAAHHFFFRGQEKRWPLDSFQGWYLSPERLQKQLVGP